jgi:hypothetical protein
MLLSIVAPVAAMNAVRLQHSWMVKRQSPSVSKSSAMYLDLGSVAPLSELTVAEV